MLSPDIFLYKWLMAGRLLRGWFLLGSLRRSCRLSLGAKTSAHFGGDKTLLGFNSVYILITYYVYCIHYTYMSYIYMRGGYFRRVSPNPGVWVFFHLPGVRPRSRSPVSP